VHDLLQPAGLGQELCAFFTCADEAAVQHLERDASWSPSCVIDHTAAALSEHG
jgi:hypothetical protein